MLSYNLQIEKKIKNFKGDWESKKRTGKQEQLKL